MTTPLSRMGFDHPAQGTVGDASLYSRIEAIFQGIGDDMPSRWAIQASVAQNGTFTMTHGLNLAFSELTMFFYTYTGTFSANTTALTRNTSGIAAIANVTNPTTQIDVTNTTGGTVNIAVLVVQFKVPRVLSDLTDVTTSGAATGQGLVYNGSQFAPLEVQGTVYQKVATRTALTTPVTVSATTDCVVISNLTSAGAVAVSLPAGVTKQVFFIADGKGDAATNNITITPAAGNINGASTYVIKSNRGAVQLIYDGTEWKIISEYISATVPITRGGTGAITANAALNNLLPSQTGNNGKILSTDGSNTSWASAPSSVLNQFNMEVGDSSNVRESVDTSLLGQVKSSYVTSTITVTIASPAVVSWTSHGLLTGDKVYFTTTIALPTGLTASTTYYVVKVDANSFNVATTLANAVAGTKINTSGSQSGTHSAFAGGLVLSTPSFIPPTVQEFTSGSGTYTLPVAPRAPSYIEIEMVGGGGGGGGSGSTGGDGAAGGDSTFGTSLLSAGAGFGGGGVNSAPTGGNGGTGSLGGLTGILRSGATGNGGFFDNSLSGSAFPSGGGGGSTPLGGAGGGTYSGAGKAAVANTGSGGGGAGGGVTAGLGSGGGGGASSYIRATIVAPSATYSYVVGSAGAGGSAGNGNAGGSAGSGYIRVTEYYQ